MNARLQQDRLKLIMALSSAQGVRRDNQDFAAFRLDQIDGPRGAAAALGDGLGGHKGGREASETTVRAFLDGYFGASPQFAPLEAATRALDAVNGWIESLGRRDSDLSGMATTFTALLLIGRRAHVLHVGDSRAYKFSDGRLEQLTQDHVIETEDGEPRLSRAIGFEAHPRIDHQIFDIHPGDRIMLCSDGLHGALPSHRIAKILAAGEDTVRTARKLKEAALKSGSADNVTVLLVDVTQIPPERRDGARLLHPTVRQIFPTAPSQNFWRLLSAVLAALLALDLLLRR